jgi:O-acetyl-ADP-ribose deacetylase (regulator of RNase III)
MVAMESLTCSPLVTGSLWREPPKVDARTVAFPAISTGIFAYPVRAATAIAVQTVVESGDLVDSVRFVCFDDETYAAYEDELTALRAAPL